MMKSLSTAKQSCGVAFCCHLVRYSCGGRVNIILVMPAVGLVIGNPSSGRRLKSGSDANPVQVFPTF